MMLNFIFDLQRFDGDINPDINDPIETTVDYNITYYIRIECVTLSANQENYKVNIVCKYGTEEGVYDTVFCNTPYTITSANIDTYRQEILSIMIDFLNDLKSYLKLQESQGVLLNKTIDYENIKGFNYYIKCIGEGILTDTALIIYVTTSYGYSSDNRDHIQYSCKTVNADNLNILGKLIESEADNEIEHLKIELDDNNCLKEFDPSNIPEDETIDYIDNSNRIHQIKREYSLITNEDQQYVKSTISYKRDGDIQFSTNSERESFIDIGNYIDLNKTIVEDDKENIENLKYNISLDPLTDVVNIEGNSKIVLYLKSDGTVWGYGYNTYGALGVGDSKSRNTITQLNISDVKKIYVYSNHNTYFLKNNGDLYGCGINNYGQLGSNVTSVTYNITLLTNDVKDFIEKNDTLFILKNDNTVWGCGKNNYGQLGLGHNSIVSELTQITSDAKEIYIANLANLLILKNDNTVWGCGYNKNGELGLGDSVKHIALTQLPITDVKSIESDDAVNTFFIKNDDTVWMSGSNYHGNAGINTTNNPKYEFIKTSLVGSDIKKMKQYNHTTYYINKNNELWGCGYNAYGQLGQGDTEHKHVFVKITDNVKNIDTFDYSLYIVKLDGTVWVCGRNLDGELCFGHNDYTSVTILSQINLNNIVDLALTERSCYFMKEDGTVWFTGGMLNNSKKKFYIENDYIYKQNIEDVAEIFIIQSSIFYKKTNGTIWACGKNTDGELGVNDLENHKDPVQVNMTDVAKVYSDANHTIFIKTDGTAWACGYNNYGQLGLGHVQTPISTPTQCLITDVVKVSLSTFNTFFLKSDGTVWGCGYNGYGQLGQGNTTKQTKPVQIKKLTNIIDIDIDIYHFVALKSDGTVWACGRNKYGQFGTGNKTVQKTPIQLTPTNVSKISNTSYNVLCLTKDGHVWGSGLNKSYKQLGDFDNDTTSFVQIAIDNVVDIVQYRHTIWYIKNDGTIWMSGHDDYSQSCSDANNLSCKPIPIQLPNISDEKILKISNSIYNLAILYEDGTIYTCGCNIHAIQSSLLTTQYYEPKKMYGDNYVDIVGSASYNYFMIRKDGTVWASGYDKDINITGYDYLPHQRFLQRENLNKLKTHFDCPQFNNSYTSTYTVDGNEYTAIITFEKDQEYNNGTNIKATIPYPIHPNDSHSKESSYTQTMFVFKDEYDNINSVLQTKALDEIQNLKNYAKRLIGDITLPNDYNTKFYINEDSDTVICYLKIIYDLIESDQFHHTVKAGLYYDTSKDKRQEFYDAGFITVTIDNYNTWSTELETLRDSLLASFKANQTTPTYRLPSDITNTYYSNLGIIYYYSVYIRTTSTNTLSLKSWFKIESESASENSYTSKTYTIKEEDYSTIYDTYLEIMKNEEKNLKNYLSTFIGTFHLPDEGPYTTTYKTKSGKVFYLRNSFSLIGRTTDTNNPILGIKTDYGPTNKYGTQYKIDEYILTSDTYPNHVENCRIIGKQTIETAKHDLFGIWDIELPDSISESFTNSNGCNYTISVKFNQGSTTDTTNVITYTTKIDSTTFSTKSYTINNTNYIDAKKSLINLAKEEIEKAKKTLVLNIPAVSYTNTIIYETKTLDGIKCPISIVITTKSSNTLTLTPKYGYGSVANIIYSDLIKNFTVTSYNYSTYKTDVNSLGNTLIDILKRILSNQVYNPSTPNEITSTYTTKSGKVFNLKSTFTRSGDVNDYTYTITTVYGPSSSYGTTYSTKIYKLNEINYTSNYLTTIQTIGTNEIAKAKTELFKLWDVELPNTINETYNNKKISCIFTNTSTTDTTNVITYTTKIDSDVFSTKSYTINNTNYNIANSELIKLANIQIQEVKRSIDESLYVSTAFKLPNNLVKSETINGKTYYMIVKFNKISETLGKHTIVEYVTEYGLDISYGIVYSTKALEIAANDHTSASLTLTTLANKEIDALKNYLKDTTTDNIPLPIFKVNIIKAGSKNYYTVTKISTSNIENGIRITYITAYGPNSTCVKVYSTNTLDVTTNNIKTYKNELKTLADKEMDKCQKSLNIWNDLYSHM